MAMQAVTADPTLLTDPIKRKFFSSWLEDGGLSMIDFQGISTPSIEQTVQETPQRAGGGISRPVIPTSPVGGEAQKQI
ncbi:MAG: hypothetical protein ACTSPI_18185 [Candidatus Heimdallarchaeaceae archaeon]